MIVSSWHKSTESEWAIILIITVHHTQRCQLEWQCCRQQRSLSLSNHLLLPSCCLQNPFNSPQRFSCTVRNGILEAHLTDTQSNWSPGTGTLNDLKDILCSGNQMPVGASETASSPFISYPSQRLMGFLADPLTPFRPQLNLRVVICACLLGFVFVCFPV